MSEKKSTNIDFPVVAIGASAGGLDAIQQLFDHLPSDSGNAYVIIQHLSPDFKSLMPELLGKHTPMEIFTAEDDLEIKPNCIYLNQRNKNLTIVGKKLKLLEKEPKNNLNLPIDIFFHALGSQAKEKAIGIILSGTGTDGSRGIKTIKEAGGIILVQDPNSAQFDGMPNSAIATNLTDFVVNLEEMAQLVVKVSSRSSLSPFNPFQLHSDDLVLSKILELVHKFSGIDFLKYKKNTLIRRIEKRMNINSIDLLTDYYVLLNSNPKEKEMLKQDFLIGVTSFFRDHEAWQLLNVEVFPTITSSKSNNETIRIWVAGCSTGEEAYSVAIALDNYIRKNSLGLDFKIFATDIDSNALAVASAGAYKVNIVHELEKYYLENYFVKTGDKLTIIKRIREKIVFSNHDIIKDPPFIRMDLISCRNLLIYLDNAIQKKVMANFHFSLNKYAFLFLGNSESLGGVSNHFRVIDAKWKIFQNVSEAKQSPTYIAEQEYKTSSFLKKTRPNQEENYFSFHKTKERPEDQFNAYLSSKFSPAAIFIDLNFKILFIKGDAGLKLIHSEGVYQNNLLKVLPTQLSLVVRSAIRKLQKDGKDILMQDVPYERDGSKNTVDLFFHKPIDQDNLSHCFLIYFGIDKIYENNNLQIFKNYAFDSINKERLEDLEEELTKTKSELQNVVEELETSNEELQSSNEELMASNEELQSTNEELQSVNEELYTVNTELQEKNKELAVLNDDINNLLDNSDIGTLFLDLELKIRKYTPALRKFFSLELTDLGRPISSFASEFSEELGKFIISQSKQILESLATVEKELSDSFGNYTLVRILPFITKSKKIDGVIINFININEIKRKEELLKTIKHELEIAQNIAQLGSWTLDVKTNEVFWSKSLYQIFQIHSTDNPPTFETHHKLFTEESWNILSPSIENTIKTGVKYEHELQIIKATGEPGWIWVTGQGEKDDKGNVIKLRGIAQEITTRKNLSLALENSTKFANKINELSPVGVHIYTIEKTNSLYQNNKAEDLLGAHKKGNNHNEFNFITNIHPDDLSKVKEYIKKLPSVKTSQSIEYRIIDGPNSFKWIYSIDAIFEYNSSGKAFSAIGVIIDITDKKKTEHELQLAMEEALKANKYKNLFLANMSHEIRTPINGILGFSKLLTDPNLTKNDRARYSDIIINNSRQLLHLVNDIIDVAKLEVGEIKIKLNPTSIEALMNNIYETFSEQLTLKNKSNLKLVKTFSPKLEGKYFLTDQIRLTQILSNLIGNSIKFSEQGIIEFGVNISNHVGTFYVRDQGIGIPKEQLNKIYERFYQINNDDSSRIPEGTGLGLSIVEGLLNLLGGTIEVYSEEGQGTEFRFQIPLRETKERPETFKVIDLEKRKKIENAKILIAEDVQENIEYFKAIFLNTNYEVQYAKSGKECLDIYLKEPDFNLILMDVRMPDMDGVTAAREIWKISQDQKIIVQTAFAMSEDETKYKSLGFTDYISKPFTKAEVLEVIEKNI